MSGLISIFQMLNYFCLHQYFSQNPLQHFGSVFTYVYCIYICIHLWYHGVSDGVILGDDPGVVLS